MKKKYKKKKPQEPAEDEAITARLQVSSSGQSHLKNESQHNVKKIRKKQKPEEPAEDEAITARLQVSSSGQRHLKNEGEHNVKKNTGKKTGRACRR